MFEESVIRKIINCWENDQNHPNRGRVKRPIPSFSDVREIVETTFLASLKREEDQPIHVSVVLCSPEENENSSHRYRREVYRLDKPFPLTPDSIQKLAPALDTNYSSMVVGRNLDKNELYCWGVSHYKPNTHRFNEIPIGLKGGRGLRHDLFTVTVKAPGSLTISRMNSNIGRFVNGSFMPSSPTPFTSHSLGSYLLGFIEKSELTEKYGNTYWINYRDSLEVLLYECSSRGHGATIVLLPPGYENEEVEFFTSRYQLSPSLGVSSQMKDVLDNERDILLGIAYGKELLERLQFLAQLSTIDGALILTSDFELVSFGATLKAAKWIGEVREGPNGFGVTSGNYFLSHKYGTRHNSAIDFSASCKGTVVFVISQDGPIRAFLSNDNNEVLCWPDCTASMFV